jgi:uncharacterized membrane protein
MEQNGKTSQWTARNLAVVAMIAALYTALCIALAPFGYGPVQIRAAEALTILPVFSPLGVWGLALGCALSNLIGFFTGMNPLGFFDIGIGTAATLLAALASRKLRHVRWKGLPVLSTLPPVLFNAVIIGAELAFIFVGEEGLAAAFVFNALSVGAGQLVACIGLGLPLHALLEKTGAATRCFGMIK